ncbi:MULTISPECIES: hypothetical protein [unclassified Streptomyces]|uniref:hypothetical protein n=1 Tax=unclassified Streptomyces TaxID=2593676 RepID=UPI00336A3AF8
MSADNEKDDDPARFLRSLQALAAASTAHGSNAHHLRQEAIAAITDWSDESSAGQLAPDMEHILRGITREDRALLAEGLRVIEQWVRQPGEETGRQVDDVVARMRRELGPLIARDRAAEETADRERLRVSVRESISRRLREARADNDAP